MWPFNNSVENVFMISLCLRIKFDLLVLYIRLSMITGFCSCCIHVSTTPQLPLLRHTSYFWGSSLSFRCDWLSFLSFCVHMAPSSWSSFPVHHSDGTKLTHLWIFATQAISGLSRPLGRVDYSSFILWVGPLYNSNTTSVTHCCTFLTCLFLLTRQLCFSHLWMPIT